MQYDYELFRVHKIILAARCPFFFTLFCSNTEWSDSGPKAIEIKHEDFDPEAMRIFLHYIYTGKIKIEFNYVISVMRIASYYGVECLLE